MDANEKDYLLDSYPSETQKKRSSAAFTFLNNKRYATWHLRASELEKTRAIIKKEAPIEFNGIIYPNYGWLGLSQGILTDDGKQYAVTKAFREGDHPKIMIIVDLINEKIVKIEKDIPFQRKEEEQANFLSLEETLTQIEKNYNKSLADNFLQVTKKANNVNNFIDSIRKELISQSGGYIENEGRKILKGKRDNKTPHRILIIEGKANELKQKILELEMEFIQLFDDLETKNMIKDKLMFNINEEQANTNGKTWEEYTFGHMPLAAIFPMLRKFQNDIKTSEAIVISYLLENK